MARAHRRFHSINDSPGPGHYNGDSPQNGSPAFSMKKSAWVNSKNNIPGPGSYEIPEKPLTKDFKFGVSNRPGKLSEAPGPGTYD